MTDRTPPIGPEIWVAGVDDRGVEQVRACLGHGEEPVTVLARLGFVSPGPKTVVAQSDPHRLTLMYPVSRGPGPAIPGSVPTPRDPGLVAPADEVPVPIQRVAAYAVVRSPRGILFSQNSALTNAEGTWGLVGGGVGQTELPEDALHREVWEEAGQRVDVGGLVAVSTRHWIGRAPHGRLEDFHAVRLIYRATCATPTDPVVHDVGGTTAAAAWIPTSQVPGTEITPGWRDLILSLVAEVT